MLSSCGKVCQKSDRKLGPVLHNIISQQRMYNLHDNMAAWCAIWPNESLATYSTAVCGEFYAESTAWNHLFMSRPYCLNDKYGNSYYYRLRAIVQNYAYHISEYSQLTCPIFRACWKHGSSIIYMYRKYIYIWKQKWSIANTKCPKVSRY